MTDSRAFTPIPGLRDPDLLEAAGLGYGDVVKTTVLLADINDFVAVNEVYARFFTGEVLPARAAFGVVALPKGAGVEIEAVAVRS